MGKQNETTIGEVLEGAGLSPDDKVKFRVINLTWLVLPLGFFLLCDWAYRTFGPHIADGDLDLLVFEAALLVLVIGFTLAAAKQRIAGWTAPKGLSWLWVAGPLWLGVLTPIGMAAENFTAMPEKIALWLAISLFVAVNEETLFRGFILRGMLRGFRPLTAVVVSSLVFGGVHFLNLAAGGDAVFVGAQMISAIGAGAVLAAMTLRAGSIIPAMLFHFAGDFIGLGALGGYEEALGQAELAPSLAISGAVFFAWGLFWSWRAVKAGKVAALK